MSALSDLSATVGRQVVVTTHTPMLARGLPDSSLRFIEAQENGIRSIVNGGEQANARIAKSLGVLPDHTVKLFVGVEGKHDIAFLKSISRVLRAEGHNVPDIDALEIAGDLIFFPFGGSNLALWTSRLRPLNRPEFHIYDRDEQPPAPGKYHLFTQQVNAREGCVAIMTAKREMENYIHHQAVQEAYNEQNIALALAGPFGDFDDVPDLVAQAVHAATAGTPWPVHDEEKCRKKVGRAKALLNTAATTKMTGQRLTEADPNNEVLGWLHRIGQMVADAA